MPLERKSVTTMTLKRHSRHHHRRLTRTIHLTAIALCWLSMGALIYVALVLI